MRIQGVMNNVLICAYDPILIKNLYAILTQDGFSVEVTDHPASAFRMVMRKEYAAAVIDCWPFGITTEDAARAMKAVCPGLPVLVMGKATSQAGTVGIEGPVDLEILRKTIRAVCGMQDTSNQNKKIYERAS
ncbi:MAG: hypothetical protein M0Z52_08260 [Actinomycetota bacterium]|nr:hypothetical protein [Actinomycetota bacterium]